MNKPNFSQRDYQVLCRILKMREGALLDAMKRVLKNYYPTDRVIFTNDYLCAWGNIPVALVAHLDTVHQTPPVEIYNDTTRGVIWSPEGLGADDRAGVFAIIKLLQEGWRPTVIFTTGEETGGIGASILVEDILEPEVPINFMIELDRQGINDMVFYHCDNPEFSEYIGKFGFKEEWGSFSDISIIAPEWGIAAVNLSIGYKDEHSFRERLHYHYMLATVEKVRNILEAEQIEDHKFTYIPAYYEDYKLFDSPVDRCILCGQQEKKENLKTIYYSGTNLRLCSECIEGYTAKCTVCGNRYMRWDDDEDYTNDYMCPSCRKKVAKKGGHKN